MRTLKTLLLTAGALLFFSAAHAQNQTITLKDGTVFTGFISRQDILSRSGEVTYCAVQRTVAIEEVLSRKAEQRELDDLSDAWKEWAVRNNKWETVRDRKVLSLTVLTRRGDVARDCYILMSGTKNITFYSISDGVESIAIDQIASVRSPERPATLLTDVNDVVQTESVTYSGIITEQVPGVSVTIWDASDGTHHSLDFKEIRSIGKSAFNPDYPIWEQTPFVERLILKDTRTGLVRSTEKGLIVDNGLGADDNILFAVPAGDGMDTRQYSYKEVMSQEKFRNERYHPRYDIILSPGEARINRDSTLCMVNPVDIVTEEGHRLFCIGVEEAPIAVVSTGHITIETRLSAPDDILVCKTLQQDIPISRLGLPVDGTAKKKKQYVEPTQAVHAFTAEMLLGSSLEVVQTVNINEISSIEATLPEAGVYAVYLRRAGTCWVVDYRPPQN